LCASSGIDPNWALAAIGAVVAGITFLQWRTSHDQTALNLFDKRYEVYRDVLLVKNHQGRSGLRDPNGNEIRNPRLNYDPDLPLSIAVRGRFLFDDDLAAELESFYQGCLEQEADPGPGHSMLLHTLFESMLPKFADHMKMPTKPWRWRRAKNAGISPSKASV